MEQPQLFADLPVADPPEPLSAGRRLTQRQRRQIELGVHPLTLLRAHPERGTCGDCPHRQPGRYPKCGLGPRTRGPATDTRAHWPACHRHPGEV